MCHFTPLTKGGVFASVLSRDPPVALVRDSAIVGVRVPLMEEIVVVVNRLRTMGQIFGGSVLARRRENTLNPLPQGN